MVLHTIIGEYDILYAQKRELAGYGSADVPQEAMSTDPRDFLAETELTAADATQLILITNKSVDKKSAQKSYTQIFA